MDLTGNARRLVGAALIVLNSFHMVTMARLYEEGVAIATIFAVLFCAVNLWGWLWGPQAGIKRNYFDQDPLP